MKNKRISSLLSLSNYNLSRLDNCIRSISLGITSLALVSALALPADVAFADVGNDIKSLQKANKKISYSIKKYKKRVSKLEGESPVFLPGIKGDLGDTGAKGAAGPQGLQGVMGATGPKGATGAAGFTGATGANGAVGATGVRANGFTGATGARGATGNDGPQGTLGVVGDTGSVGVAGNPGNPGLDGPVGQAGPVGNVDYSACEEVTILGPESELNDELWADVTGLCDVGSSMAMYYPELRASLSPTATKTLRDSVVTRRAFEFPRGVTLRIEPSPRGFMYLQAGVKLICCPNQ